jgi:hypothetical protein
LQYCCADAPAQTNVGIEPPSFLPCSVPSRHIGAKRLLPDSDEICLRVIRRHRRRERIGCGLLVGASPFAERQAEQAN